MKKTTLKFEKLTRDLNVLKSLYQKPPQTGRSNIYAKFEKFEFTFDLLWNFLRILLKIFT